MLGVEIENLGKRFGAREAVRGVSLGIGVGEIFGLLGPNGAGKTTLLSMLATLVAPGYGDARIFGHSLTSEVRAVRRLVGLVPQDISLYPQLTAQENLAFFGQLYGVPGRPLHARVEALLELVGLLARRTDLVETFSGGMKRRLNLAAGLVHEPRLLLLDEPTVGVDPQSRRHILEAIRAIADQGTTVLYTTHYMEEAERLCERIAIMDEGRVIAVGTLPELLARAAIDEIIEVRWTPSDLDRARLRAIDGVTAVEAAHDTTRIRVSNAGLALGPIATIVAARTGTVPALAVHPANLEGLFLHLTGKALRD